VCDIPCCVHCIYNTPQYAPALRFVVRIFKRGNHARCCPAQPARSGGNVEMFVSLRVRVQSSWSGWALTSKCSGGIVIILIIVILWKEENSTRGGRDEGSPAMEKEITYSTSKTPRNVTAVARLHLENLSYTSVS